MHHRQAKAGAFAYVLGSEEGLRRLGQRLLVHPFAVVLDRQLEAGRVVHRNMKFHLAAVVREFNCVGEKVVEDLLEFLLVERDVA